MTTLDNQVLKGFHLKVIYTIIASTGMICLTLSGVYYGLKEQIKNIEATQETKWAVHEVEYKGGVIRLEKVEELTASNEKRITSVETKQSN